MPEEPIDYSNEGITEEELENLQEDAEELDRELYPDF